MTHLDGWVEDGFGNGAMKCDRVDCQLHVVRPGCFDCPCESAPQCNDCDRPYEWQDGEWVVQCWCAAEYNEEISS